MRTMLVWLVMTVLATLLLARTSEAGPYDLGAGRTGAIVPVGHHDYDHDDAGVPGRGLRAKVWTDRGGDAVYRPGDDVLVRFRVSEDAYVCVYNIDTEGRPMPAFGIGAELNLVDGQEGNLPVLGHRLDGAQEIARIIGNDAFFAGNQGGRTDAAQAHHTVIILARQQAQRKADHAGFVAQHAVDRQIGLAGIGRSWGIASTVHRK